jgi:hypothetical protein
MARRVTRIFAFAALGLLGASAVFAGCPSAYPSTVPCAIVLVGHNVSNTAADPYGAFSVIIRDAAYNPSQGLPVTVDFSACCPDIRLSNTQLGVGVSHVANSAIVTAVTDDTGTATFIVEGAASQGGGASTGTTGASGCAQITVWCYGVPFLLTNGIDHPTVLVSAPDENGAAGSAGVDVTDLSVWIEDKNAYSTNTANYRQRSDFDFHLPEFTCPAVFSSSSGLGVNLDDLAEWMKIKNAGGSYSNGPFPVTCP